MISEIVMIVTRFFRNFLGGGTSATIDKLVDEITGGMVNFSQLMENFELLGVGLPAYIIYAVFFTD